jgi:hypothetical protein
VDIGKDLEAFQKKCAELVQWTTTLPAAMNAGSRSDAAKQEAVMQEADDLGR